MNHPRKSDVAHMVGWQLSDEAGSMRKIGVSSSSSQRSAACQHPYYMWTNFPKRRFSKHRFSKGGPSMYEIGHAQLSNPNRMPPSRLTNRNHILFAAIITLLCFVGTEIAHLGETSARAASPELLSYETVGEHSPASRTLTSKQGLSEGVDALGLLNDNDGPHPSRVYPPPKLERVTAEFNPGGTLSLRQLPAFQTTFAGRYAGVTEKGQFVHYSLDPELQAYASQLVSKSTAPHLAVVAMEPQTGRILAIANRSVSIKDLSLHTGFPAASLFKVITSAAAIERTSLTPDSLIKFRGGTYTLNQWNYKPDFRSDRREYSISEALGLSCNPVFARIALLYLKPLTLEHYSRAFGFNTGLGFEVPLKMSHAEIPEDDFGFSRTSAGFGAVTISPVHAAALMSGVANGGLLPRPSIVDRVTKKDGEVAYQNRPQYVQRMVQPYTAKQLLRMMESTTTIGTSRHEFQRSGRPLMPGVRVAAKTGTLRGTNPKGLNHWFIAAAPIEDPKIAVAVIALNPPISSKASKVGRMLIEKHLTGQVSPEVVYRKPYKSKAKPKIYRSPKKYTSKKSTKKK